MSARDGWPFWNRLKAEITDTAWQLAGPAIVFLFLGLVALAVVGVQYLFFGAPR